MTLRDRRIISPWLLPALLLSGCATSPQVPDPVQPQPPAAWQESADRTPLDSAWWQSYQAPVLNQLIEQALAQGPDVAMAAARVQQAEASVNAAGASLFPSLSFSGSSGSRRSTSTSTTTTGATTGAPNSGSAPTGTPSGPATGTSTTTGTSTVSSVSHSTSASLSLSYELDLWGRISAGVQAANANLEGSRLDLATARLTLISGVANAYFQVLALRARLAVARDTLAAAERIFAIIEVRYRNGAASALDVSRQKATVLNQRAVIQPLEIQERQTLRALAVLLGSVPQEFSLQSPPLEQVTIPSLGAELPATVLTRRPDIAKLESQIVAANANLAAARTALLPTISLSASGGLSGVALLSLQDPSRSVSLIASLAQSLFDGGRQQSQVDSNLALRRQTLESYRKGILTALKEVDDALGNVVRFRDQESAQIAIRDEAARALKLAELRYKEGAGDYSSVLDAQRTLFSAQDQTAQLRLSRLTASVDLAKALGGGVR